MIRGLASPVFPLVQLKMPPRAIKSDCGLFRKKKKSDILLTTSLGLCIKNYAMLSFLSGRLQTNGFLTPF